ncbi:hypothetical protein BU17DRAFT_41798 [Hysterangium stoloniferum]|nr:hypothetical protein BU17DRAFT_41798 [Hysterangium stoloniferum]
MALLRFAPSPTGSLHLGGLRTAFLNHLIAKQLKGKWILRIEDTDNERFVEGSVENIRRGLEWAGLDYDYGPGIVGGPHGPYFQSKRLDLYHNYANRLLESRHAYRCFCSPDKLKETKDRLHQRGSSATYDRACLHLTEEEVARRVKHGEKSIIRIHDESIPKRGNAPDLVFGDLRDAHRSLPTDPVLLKSDLFPTYHLASVVDDSEMGITHVLRGEEWLTSLPLHLDIYACLSIEPPHFAHLPILLNSDGTKMSKRAGHAHVATYIAEGWEPEAVLNWLVLAGWGNRTGTEKLEYGKSIPDVFTLEQLSSTFKLSALTTRRGALDRGILRHLNKEHIKLKSREPDLLSELVRNAMPVLRENFSENTLITEGFVGQVILTLSDRLSNIADIGETAPYFFVEPEWDSDKAVGMKASVPQQNYADAIGYCIKSLDQLHLLQWRHDVLEPTLYDARKHLGHTSKHFMTTLRHALTALKDGPSVISTMETLGKERTLSRLRHCQAGRIEV